MEENKIKFAHLADCHLGGWRQEALQNLNFESFQKTIEIIIQQNINFVLISGDLFDSAYPPIEILKSTFAEFKKLHDAKIPVYLIAGSHDFSASGKTFLDVLEKAGFCKNVNQFEIQEDGKIKLIPTIEGDIGIYGYSGKKSGMEVEDIKNIYLDKLHSFTILMLHTTLEEVVGTLPVESIQQQKLPLANYYAMGHIHKRYEDDVGNSKYVYPGPTFPNNFQELSDLKHGSFHIVETDGVNIKTQNITIPLKETATIKIEITNALTATQEIISALDKYMLTDKIVLLKLTGTLTQGKTGDIKFEEIENFIKKKGAYAYLRNITSIKIPVFEMGVMQSENDIEEIEKQIAKTWHENNPNDFNEFHYPLMSALSLEKIEDEKTGNFEERLLSELKNILKLSEIL